MVCTRVDIHAFYAYVLHTIIKAIPYLERPKTKTKTTNKTKKTQKIKRLTIKTEKDTNESTNFFVIIFFESSCDSKHGHVTLEMVPGQKHGSAREAFQRLHVCRVMKNAKLRLLSKQEAPELYFLFQ